MVFDVTTSLNFIFGIIIVILGLWVYKRKQYVLALYIALGFGIFALSHLEVMMGLSSSDVTVTFIRSLGYLVIIYALLREALLR